MDRKYASTPSRGSWAEKGVTTIPLSPEMCICVYYIIIRYIVLYYIIYKARNLAAGLCQLIQYYNMYMYTLIYIYICVQYIYSLWKCELSLKVQRCKIAKINADNILPQGREVCKERTFCHWYPSRKSLSHRPSKGHPTRSLGRCPPWLVASAPGSQTFHHPHGIAPNHSAAGR